jgi:ABC-type oligopeptide transport system substrate-binding subunit
VRTRSFPLNRYLRRLRAGDQQIYRLGWIAEYPVPDVFLSDLFGSDSPDNHSGFSSARVDRMLERARRTGSGSSRVQRYIEAEKAILRRLPVIPIGSFVTHWVAQQRVQGIRFDSMGGFDAVGISIADDAAESESESESENESENEGD